MPQIVKIMKIFLLGLLLSCVLGDPECQEPFTCTIEVGGDVLNCLQVPSDQELGCQLQLHSDYSELYIRYSSITSLDGTGTGAPRSLDVSFNRQLTSVKPEVFQNDKMKDAIFKSNGIYSFPFTYLSPAKSLVFLSLLDNGIKVLPDSIPDVPNLEHLDLNHNLIKDVPAGVFSSLSSLKMVQLADNKIASLLPQAFGFKTQGVGVDLGWNKLSEFTLDVFLSSSLPRFLDLRENLLTYLPETTFRPIIENMKSFGSRASLLTSGNPVACTCDLRWLYDWGYREREIQNFVHVSCTESAREINIWESKVLHDCPPKDQLEELNST